jgi:16S rRNA (cytidine1402-2'-O)-methyltransferase
MLGTLYVVATPIGNLEDITLRALRILREVNLIACEDTRQTSKLLHHYAITCPTISYHAHNEKARTTTLINRLLAGENLALVSDAGTPLISDPGLPLIAAAIAANIPVVAIPGASALLAALVGSGWSLSDFYFIGFLPARSGERKRRLQAVAETASILVCYETPHRITAALTDLLAVLGPRPAIMARELTKLHEEFRRQSLPDLLASVQLQPPKGEIVLLIDLRADRDSISPAPRLATLSAAVAEKMRTTTLSKMAALKLVARERGISKSEAYRQLQQEETQL